MRIGDNVIKGTGCGINHAGSGGTESDIGIASNFLVELEMGDAKGVG